MKKIFLKKKGKINKFKIKIIISLFIIIKLFSNLIGININKIKNNKNTKIGEEFQKNILIFDNLMAFLENNFKTSDNG